MFSEGSPLRFCFDLFCLLVRDWLSWTKHVSRGLIPLRFCFDHFCLLVRDWLSWTKCVLRRLVPLNAWQGHGLDLWLKVLRTAIFSSV